MKSLMYEALSYNTVHNPFKKEKKLVQLQSGAVVEHFDIEKDCAWCGKQLSKGYRFTEYYEYTEDMSAFKNKIISRKMGDRDASVLQFSFHASCANAKYGKEVAIGPD